MNKIIKALLYPACVDCHEGMHAKERKQFHSLMETIHPIFYIKAQLTPGAACVPWQTGVRIANKSYHQPSFPKETTHPIYFIFNKSNVQVDRPH
ncbi:MAG: hypothetical protein IPJ13_03670 [Saprospiraceae bacterium]|nr:hypothetical protein [Saprospiraceae bacterium]MBP6446599.1 hypothetical protein [Saprospiraceae bacterium]